MADTPEFDVYQGGFESADEALQAGLDVKFALRVALTRRSRWVDFGEHSARSQFSPEGLQQFRAPGASQVVHGPLGLQVFEDLPKTQFIDISADAHATTPAAAVTELAETHLESDISTEPSLKLAFEILHASHFENGDRARFLLLVAAMEALIRPQPRRAESLAFVTSLMNQAKQADLQTSEKDAIQGALKSLLNESISKAGRRLSQELLGLNEYAGVAPAKFFTKVCSARSRLVHSGDSGMRPEPFRQFTAVTWQFVRDLLLASIDDRTKVQ